MQRITPFLMFTGRAEEAMNFYISLFPDSEVIHITRYGENEQGAAGTVRLAEFSLDGQHILCIDSPPVHEFTFTPSTSLYVACRTEDEVDTLFAALTEGGQTLMPLDAYPFSAKYAWVNDRFGVSWQLALVEEG
jgi:predicted 3-demethylubiquinone-9 3-methyltransferase (glyoxalase superfamily)